MTGYLILLSPLVIAVAVALKWHRRPILRVVVVLAALAPMWFLIAGLWIMRHKPVYGDAPAGPSSQRFDDYVAGAQAMSRVLETSFFFLFAATVVLSAAFVIDGFHRRAEPSHPQQLTGDGRDGE